MANKTVTTWPGCLNDEVASIGSTTFTSGTTVQDLVDNDANYSLVDNPNGQKDLEFEIDDQIESLSCHFKAASNGISYYFPTFDVIGPQPKDRRPS